MKWVNAALRVVGATVVCSLIAFVGAYAVFGAVYGYAWTTYDVPDGQNGLGAFLAFLYSCFVMVGLGVIALGVFAWRELKRFRLV